MTDTSQPAPTLATVTLRGRVGGLELTIAFPLATEELKERITRVLEQLTAIGIEAPLPDTEEDPGPPEKKERRQDDKGDAGGGEGPYVRLSRELDIAAANLQKVLGIKGDTVQLYKASKLAPSDAAAALCLSYEKGLGRAGMPYDTFTSILSSHVKMKTPVSTFCFNLIRDGVVQKKPYEDGRTIVLSPAGEKKGEAAIKKLLAGEAKAK
jgi:hypothetical protein